MFCKNCGFNMAPGTRFCPNCGADNGVASTPGYGAAPSGGAAPGYGTTPGYGTAPGYGAYPTRSIEKKNIATAIILSLITCGIYSIIWFISLTDDANHASGEPMATSGGMAFLLSLITCGIYTLVWAYKQGEKLDKLAQMRGQAPSSRGLTYLLLSFFGLGIVAYALMQDSLNKLA